MDIPEWVIEASKIGSGTVIGAVAGVRGATWRMEKRVRSLEDRQAAADKAIASHEITLDEVHETVKADHDLLTRMDANLQLIMGAMQLRPRP